MGVGPFLPFPNELLQLLRLLGCEVMTLSPVVRHEIELPFVGHLVANGFPVVPPHIAVVGMFAEDVFVELLVGMTPDFVIVSPKNFHRIGMLFSDDASLALLC